MSLDHLWAGWRSAYVRAGVAARTERVRDDEDERSVFERILQSGEPDEETFVVRRSAHAATLLNIYPYTSGHLLVLPVRAVPELEQLSVDEHQELWEMVRDAVVALRSALRCEGVNVGANLGAAAGAGVPDHLHVHVVPRWDGDTNFMTTLANTRVLPVSLSDSWERIRAAWPQDP